MGGFVELAGIKVRMPCFMLRGRLKVKVTVLPLMATWQVYELQSE